MRLTMTIGITLTLTAANLAAQTTIRLNVGGNAYTDPLGNFWAADAGQCGGFVWTIPGPSIPNTTTLPIYQTMRYNDLLSSLTCTFGVVNANYNVTLKWAEIAGDPNRKFHIDINGVRKLSDFSPKSSAGDYNIAVDRTFLVNAASGQISITLTATGSSPTLHGIEIVPATTQAPSLNPTMPATEYVRMNGRVLALIKRPAALFTDFSAERPYFESAHMMYERGITTGCSGAPLQFCGEDTFTRGQMAVFIIRGLSYAIYGDTTSLITGANTPPATAYFTDVTSGHPYFAFIQKMRELNITSGCTATTYCPDDPLLTSQMAVFTVRAWKRRTDTACGVSPGCPTYDSFTCAGGAACELLPGYFADIEGHSHKKWIQKAREVSITTAGCGNGYYCPNSAMSRGASSLYVTRGLLNEFEY